MIIWSHPAKFRLSLRIFLQGLEDYMGYHGWSCARQDLFSSFYSIFFFCRGLFDNTLQSCGMAFISVLRGCSWQSSGDCVQCSPLADKECSTAYWAVSLALLFFSFWSSWWSSKDYVHVLLWYCSLINGACWVSHSISWHSCTEALHQAIVLAYIFCFSYGTHRVHTTFTCDVCTYLTATWLKISCSTRKWKQQTASCRLQLHSGYSLCSYIFVRQMHYPLNYFLTLILVFT